MKTFLFSFKPVVITLVVLITSIASSHAAVVATGVDQFLDNDPSAASLVNNTGQFDIAINFGDDTDATINGITFTGYLADWIPEPFATATSVTGGTGVTVAAGTSTSGNMRDVANFGLWGGATFAPLAIDILDTNTPNQSMNFAISGLDAGRTYTMQFFSMDGRVLTGFETDITYTLDGVAQTGTITDAANNLQGMIANFEVTGETSVNLTVSGAGNIPTPIQGLSITSIPEPSSIVMIGLGGLAMALVLRRRK